MNIEFQTAGLIVNLIFIIFYASRHRLKLYSENIFFGILLTAFAVLILDIGSVAAIAYQSVLPEFLVTFVCKAYLIFLIFSTCNAFVYLLTDVLEEKVHRRVMNYLYILIMVDALIVFLLPIYTYHQGRIVYTYGPCAMAVYGLALIYITLFVATALFCRKRMNKRRWYTFIFWITIWIMAIILQFFFSELLLVSFAGTLGVLILFVFLENPEANYNRQIGCFNHLALENYLNQLFANGEEFQILAILLSDGSEKSAEELRLFIRQQKNEKDSYIFYNQDRDYIYISKNGDQIKKAVAALWDYREKNPMGFMRHASVVLVHNGLMARKAESVSPMIRYYSRQYRGMYQNQLLEITDQMAEEFGRFDIIREKIKLALDEDRVEVFYQPIYQTEKQRFTSAEALARIRNRDGSIMYPNVFIPVAEYNGMIVQLGERVFEKTCQFISEGAARDLGLEFIDVNLSVVQCQQDDLAERLLHIISRYDISPLWINLEITETAALNAKKKMLRNMDRLMEKGMRFSLDDFGKGESNLMYIVEMPVSVVKLDFDMTKAYFKLPKARHVIHAVVKMAHEMGLTVVAEGIETKEELDVMLSEKIDYIQGYYFAKPMPEEEFLSFLDRNQGDQT